MELVWTAFILGVVGSIHCATMCGPLVIAVTNMARPGNRWQSSRVIYHAGRLATYCAIGVLFGAVGKTFALAGLQRGLSMVAGAAILVGLTASARSMGTRQIGTAVAKLKQAFARVLQTRSLPAQFVLGGLNGLLPCGLVYIAAAGAATTLSPWLGAAHMLAFGAGTLPMMFGVSVAGHRITLFASLRKLIPASIALVAILLLLRGMALGIPYVSPSLSSAAPACH